MNKWKIYIAGIVINTGGGGDYETLWSMGIFDKIEQLDYFQTFETDNLWIYRVTLNNKSEIAVIKRTENETT